MRGSAAFRAAVAPGGVLAGPWARNELWRRARAVPSLDLRFADNKSLVDATTGQNLVTFTRASSGTYVGSDGLIKTATTNLLLRSEEFNDAAWSKSNSSATSNAVVAPNGTLTADKLVEDTNTGGHLFTQSVSGIADSASLCASCYCKAAERNWVAVTVTDKAGAINRRWFNLSNGSQGTTNGTVSVFSATSVGDGWYRIAVTASAGTGASAPGIRISLGTADNTASYTGDGTSGLFLWGAQLEPSTTVGEYIPTTSTINSAPRFDHNPTTGESLGLLVEEQRTNLLLQSEDFSTTWLQFNTNIATNTGTSPAGSSTADKIIANTTNGQHFRRQDVAITASTTYTLSVYAKADGYNFIAVSPGAFAIADYITWFDLSSGTIGTNTAGNTASIQSMGNGWYKCSVTRTTNVGQVTMSNRFYVCSADNVSSFEGDNASGIYLWGAQLEAGSFPTSYIPTTSSTVTRSADVASITGSNFSSWYRQDEGTVFAEATSNHSHGGTNQFPRIASLSDGTTATRIDLLYRVLSTYTDAGYSVVNSNVSQASFDTNRQSNGTRLSVGYQINNFAFAQAGSILNGATDNSGTVPVVNQLSIGRRSGTDLPLNGTIRRLTYWPQRLPNETLQAVTQ